jgi:deoxyribodipyrimidine photo-lyase
MMSRAIVWFRRDLRGQDHPALASALRDHEEVIPVFVFDDPLLRSHLFGAACVRFMLDCLTELQRSLAESGLSLRWRRGDPREEIPKLAREARADTVLWNRDYEPIAVERDHVVMRALAKQGVAVRTFKDHVVFESDEIRTAGGEGFQRYGAYRAKWWAKWQVAAPESTTLSSVRRFAPVPCDAIDPLPSSSDLGYEDMVPVITGGERQALARLRSFLDGAIHRYGVGRNRPAQDETSVLSPHFRVGTLSPRSAIRQALQTLTHGRHQRNGASRSDVVTWIDELVWRDFFHQVLANYPHVAGEPFRASAVAPARPDGPEANRLFQAWREGRTGYPLVDAGMRQLNHTGWMHNRVRMVAASFLVKDLRLDWRWGERYFMSRLLDADLAVNNGNWQWCASTGTDAMPGYRIFNPAVQGKKFDSEGQYVRRYVPELAPVPDRYIHEPWRMGVDEQERYGCRIGLQYPTPLVDHEQARREYLALAEAARTA